MRKIFTSFLLSFFLFQFANAQKILTDEVINFTELATYEKKHPELTKHCKTCRQEEENDRWEDLVKPNRKFPKNANIKIGIFPTSPTQITSISRSPVQNWLGHTDPGTGIPPDTHGSVGLNHVITSTNDFVKIHAKIGGAQISQVSISTFTNTPGTCDPYMIFDPSAQRWIFSAINCSNTADNPMILMVSLTPDPTGAWRRITWISAGASHFLDHPYAAFDANWIVLSGRRFSGAFQGASLYIINKADMYAGTTISWGTNAQQIDKTPSDGDAPLPVTVYDPPFSTVGNPSPGTFYVLQGWNGSSIRLSTITGTLPTWTWNTTTSVFPSAGANTWNNGSLGDFAEQMVETRKIATNDARISCGVMMNGKIWCSQTIALPASGSNRAAIQWWKLDGAAGGNFGNVLQRGRIGDANANEYRFFSSLAVNKDEDVLIGYTFSTPLTRLNSAYSTRQFITPINTVDDDFIYKTGVERYWKNFGGARARWGDYSHSTLDPVDNSLWTIQEYAATPNGTVPPDNNSRYGVWWAQVAASNTPPAPVINAVSSALVSESCIPANNAIDPNETVTVSLCLKNVGNSNSSNLTATLLPTGGVTSPSSPQSYGVVTFGGASVCKDFTFTANGSCGGNIVATLQLQDGATNLGTITYNFTLGGVTSTFTQNFDAVVVPALPTGWVASNLIAGGTLWVTSNSGTPVPIAVSTPNSLFIDNATILSDKIIESPSIPVTSALAKLSFSNNYNAEPGWDGGVLEISINGAAYQDIIAAGGSFISGGYSDVLGTGSSLAGRSAWTGTSPGYITTNVKLPVAAAGQNIKVRFRFASDDNTAGQGWRIDNFAINEPACCLGCSNVTIINQPSNSTVCAGSNATFNVVAGGSTPTYQWQVSTTGIAGPYSNLANAAPYSGVSTATLNVTGLTPAMDGNYYRAVVNNSCPSTVTSNSAQLTVSPASSPVITLQPVSTSACAGANATFTTTATGAGLSYQWQVSTNAGALFTNINTAIGTTYTVTSVTPAMNNNQYRVIVTGGCPSTNTTTSNAATLTVNTSNLAITTNPSSQTVCAGTNASFSVTATGTGVTYQWQVSTNGGGTYNDLFGANSNPLVLTGVTVTMSGNLYRVIIKGTAQCDPAAGITSAGALLSIQTVPAITTQPTAVTSCPGTSATFTVGATGTNLTYQWQSSATGCTGTFTNIPGAQSASYNIASTTVAMNGTGYRVIVSGTCTPSQTSSCVLLNVTSGITINSQPVSTAACASTNATFSVTVTGSSPLYQWQVSTDGGTTFTDISGANANTLTLTGVTVAINNNQYHVLISNTCTPAVTSNNATLTIQNAVVITTQPIASLNVCTGTVQLLSVAATGSGITYQWQSAIGGCTGSFTNIPSANGSTYTPSTAIAGVTGYRVIVSGICTPAGIASNCTLVTVVTTTVISTQSVNQSKCVGDAAQFTVAVAGGSSYQWQISTNGGTSFTDISGAISAVYNIPVTTVAMNGNQYKVIIGGCPGPVTSNAAILTVQTPVSIIAHPISMLACTGFPSTLSVTTAGNNLTYQWQSAADCASPFVNIPGANSATFTAPAVLVGTSAYRVIVSGASATCPVTSITSVCATVSVGITPVVVLTAAPVTAYNPSVNGGLYITVSPVGNYTYQWKRNNVILPNLISSTSLTKANGLLDEFGSYQVTVFDIATGCQGISNIVTVSDIPKQRNRLFVSPNPTRGIVKVSFYSNTTASQKRIMTLYDNKGSKIMSKTFTLSGNYGTFNVDLSSMSNGTYMLILRDIEENIIASEKIIKQ